MGLSWCIEGFQPYNSSAEVSVPTHLRFEVSGYTQYGGKTKSKNPFPLPRFRFQLQTTEWSNF